MNEKEHLKAQLENDLKSYKHKIEGKVMFSDVDMFGIVHNIKYFYWLEYARTEYLGNLGIYLRKNIMDNDFILMSVHNEADYFGSSSLSDKYEIYTRVKSINKSSITFENLVKLLDGDIIAKSTATLVYVNIVTRQPEKVPDNLRELINDFEG